ncbi:MAG: exodeoxyribonuclease V subunit alpha [Betaproteobacteria bacterium]|nr:MAG: exodeoxyribonuclease V subunit alpha [Betaproteobacteria bacterium]
MTTPNDLAAGFAEHVQRWAANRGASIDALAVLKVAAGRASLATAEGHVCIPLAAIASELEGKSADALRELLLASGMAGMTQGEPLPLVLDDANRLYLRRYFDYERRLAENLVRRAALGAAPPAPGAKPDWQKHAVALAMSRRLTVISGGPGTGKTTTVAALLERILQENPQARIALAAPTGKAAARMLDTLRERAASLSPLVRERLPSESHTIHRLLGVTPQAGRFRHDANNPLPLDALVVDEASMLDLALAARLVEAVPGGARLVFLGDKDQLAAVEVGSVFAELSAREGSPLAASVVWFTESYRFAADSGIGRLAADINAGEPDRALDWMKHGADESVTWIDDAGAELMPDTRKRILEGYAPYLAALRAGVDDKAAVFKAFARFRLLSAVRDTPRGVREMNRMVERHARAQLDHPLDPGGRSPWYPGRPVMVMRNDYMLRLFNGDIGICLPDEDGKLAVWFPGASDAWRAIAPNRLPEHEDAWASTVHKAQGSEFDTFMCVLPETAGPVMVRELLYTAVTRARQRVTLVGGAEVFRAACLQQTERHAGLIERMREALGSE